MLDMQNIRSLNSSARQAIQTKLIRTPGVNGFTAELLRNEAKEVTQKYYNRQSQDVIDVESGEAKEQQKNTKSNGWMEISRDPSTWKDFTS